MNRLRSVNVWCETVSSFYSSSGWKGQMTIELDGFGYKATAEGKQNCMGWHKFGFSIPDGIKSLGSLRKPSPY